MGRQYDREHWGLPGQNAYYSGSDCSIATDRALLSAALWDYAHARRNQLGIVYQLNMPIVAHHPSQYYWGEALSVPVGERLTPRVGQLKVWLYARVVISGESNAVDFLLTLGDSSAKITITSTAAAWYSATLDVPTVLSPDHRLVLRHRSRGTNSFVLLGVSAYQLSTSGTAVWTDLDVARCKFGTQNYPASAHMYRLARNCINYMHHEWAPRSNVLNHWFGNHHFSAFSFENIGRYRVRKRAGPTAIRIVISCYADAAGTAEIRTTYGGVQKTTSISVGTTPSNTWLTDYTGLSASALETELIVEGRLTGGAATEVMVFGRAVIEVVSSVPAVTLPDIFDARPRAPIKAGTMSDLRSLLCRVRDVQSRSILMTDWCWGGEGYQTYYNYATAWNKNDRPFLFHATSMIARALAYISSGTRRLMFRLGYQTTAGESHPKMIQYQLTHDLVNQENYDAKGPMPGDMPYTVRYPVYEYTAEIAGELLVPDDYAHYNDASATPRWVTAQAITEHTDEYIIPQYLMIHELTLEPEDM